MDAYRVLLGVQYASIALMLIMCALIVRMWRRPQHKWLFAYGVATLVNNAGYLAIMQARTLEAAVSALQLSYLGRAWIPFALLQFTVALCGGWRRRDVSVALAAAHALTYLLVLTLPYNTLYYGSYAFVDEGLFPHLTHTNGVWHHVHDALILSYVAYGLWRLLGRLRALRPGRQRTQLVLITAAILTDACFFVLELFRVAPGFDVTMLGYTIATIFLYLAIIRFDILGARELARDVVVESVSEGVIVADDEGTIIDFNRRAAELLPALESRPQEALDEVRSLIAEGRTLDREDRRFTPKEELLADGERAAGAVYMLADDTRHYRHAERLTREMMVALSKTVDAKDHYTNGHSERVARYAKEIARRLGKDEPEQEKIFEMGLLHDIGKIGVSEEILNKPGRLTDEEFAQIKRHTIIGHDILAQISAMPELADGARSHHERYGGGGYPDGLVGTDIPEAARIICVADCYDAMTSTRTYSRPRAQEVVRAEVERCRGSQFDPTVADVMLAMIDDDVDYEMHE